MIEHAVIYWSGFVLDYLCPPALVMGVASVHLYLYCDDPVLMSIVSRSFFVIDLLNSSINSVLC
jgi:hypothetical protein